MNPHLGITRTWADGEYRFLMRPPELNALQSASKIPLLMLYQNTQIGNLEFDTLLEGVRLLLIGGGTSPENAKRLLKDYIIEPQRFEEAYELFLDGFKASMTGYAGEDLPKHTAPKESSEQASHVQTATSPSGNSTIASSKLPDAPGETSTT